MTDTASNSNQSEVLAFLRKLAEDVGWETELCLWFVTLDSELVSILITVLLKQQWQQVRFFQVTLAPSNQEVDLAPLAAILVTQTSILRFNECSREMVLAVLCVPSLECVQTLLIYQCNDAADAHTSSIASSGQQQEGAGGWDPLATLLQNSPNLQSLFIIEYDLYEPSWARVLASCRQLEILSVQWLWLPPNLYADGVCHQQRLLDWISDGPAGAIGIGSLLKPRADPSRLKQLTLTYMQLGDDHAAALFRFLETRSNPAMFPNLVELDLSNNEIGDSGAKHIAKSLPHASKLQKLWLGRNMIGTEGVTAIALALPNVTELQLLSLAYNPDWVDSAYDELQNGLRQNLSLVCFEYHKHSDVPFPLDYYPELNEAGRKYFLRSPMHPPSLWPRWLSQVRRGRFGPRDPDTEEGSDNEDDEDDDEEFEDSQRYLDTVFYFLRNSSILFEPRVGV